MKLVYLTLFIAISAACSDSNFKGGVQSSPAPVASANVDKAPTPAPSTPAPAPAAPVGSSPTVESLISDCAKAAGSLSVVSQSITYKARNGCNFGMAPNIAANNSFVTAAETTTQTLNLPKGKICDIDIESAPGAQLRYDDMLVLSIDTYAVFVSTVNLLPFLEKKDNVYIWDFSRAVGKQPADFGGKSYCIGEAADCIIPDTDKTGPVAIKLNNSKIAPISVAIQGKTSATMNLTAMGDNDSTDCSHTDLDVKVTFKYIP